MCNQCHFERVVEDGGDAPAEVLIRHGRRTGHKVSVEKQAPQA